jgi:hypothetical protein
MAIFLLVLLYTPYTKSHYIEAVHGDIFMEQKMRFELVLGWLAILKKKWGPIMSNF